jgi:hypothetical protein
VYQAQLKTVRPPARRAPPPAARPPLTAPAAPAQLVSNLDARYYININDFN